MRGGAGERANQAGGFAWPWLSLEKVILAAAVLTGAALYFREPLTARHMSLKPDANGTEFKSYFFSDESSGGSSTAREQRAKPLTWSCNLTTKYEHGYCGFGLQFDPRRPGDGLDLRRFDSLRVRLDYEGPGRSLRVALKNKDPRYLALGAPSADKVSQGSVPVRTGEQTIDLKLDQLVVAEWWKDNASRPSPELARSDFDNIVALEILTGVESRAGSHRIVVREINFKGTAISREAWYAGLSLLWLLLVSCVLLQRRREATAWQKQLTRSLQTTLDTIPHMVWSLDRQGQFHFNERWVEFAGVPLGRDGSPQWWDLIHPDERQIAMETWNECVRSGETFAIECRLRHRSGRYRWAVARAEPAVDASGCRTGWYGTCTDIHDRVTAQRALVESVASEREKSRQLKWTSEHDALTSLPNRRAFQARLEQATSRAIEPQAQVGLLLIDLDHFKHVNDSLGHPAGDDLLKAIADRLREAVPSPGFVARLGGDEFAIILEKVSTEKDLVTACDAVLSAIHTPLRLDDHVIRPGASIGGASFPKDGSHADDLFKAADAALCALKRSGRGGFRLFRSHMLEEVKRAALQLGRAREVVAENSIVAFYQPKVALSSGAVVGFEALLRYERAGGEMGLPDSLHEAFKDYELSAKIGELMQRRVARDIRAWTEMGLNFGRVSINASPAEFLRDDYAERLLRVLAQHDVPAHQVEVEVTEHALFDRGPEYVARALTVLKQVGVTVSLDDFGTGHSSLSHMRDFPVDVIKIDKSFIARMVEDQEIAALVAGVIHLARSLGLEVVAEGIETQQQLDLLRATPCQFVQGHLFGLPVPAAAIGAYTVGNAALSGA